MEKIRIAYLSDNPQRIKSAKEILMRMEAGNITSTEENEFQTSEAVYRFICCRNQKKYSETADQAIIDFREPMRSIAESMLRNSCVPEEFQVIDDRSIGASDS